MANGDVSKAAENFRRWLPAIVIMSGFILTLAVTVQKSTDHETRLDAHEAAQSQHMIDEALQNKTLEHTREGMKAAAGILEQLEERITKTETNHAVHEAEFKSSMRETTRRLEKLERKVMNGG